jgi:hypothetical protein
LADFRTANPDELPITANYIEKQQMPGLTNSKTADICSNSVIMSYLWLIGRDEGIFPEKLPL